MEAMKVKTILEWETPQNRKDIQKFNGFCNFYHQYVQGYSKVAQPITRLMGNAPFEWGLKEQAVFDELKHLIASEEVTAQPHPIGVTTLGHNTSHSLSRRVVSFLSLI